MLRHRKSKVQRRSKIIALRKLKSALKKKRSRRGDGGGKKLCGSGSDGFKQNKDVSFFIQKLKGEKLTSLTKTIFTSFFDKFKANQVRIEDAEIEKTGFTTLEPNYVFSHMYEDIKNHINITMTNTYTYTTIIKERVCNISITVDGRKESFLDIKQYIYMMVFWLNIISQFTDSVCNNKPLQIFVILTDLKKELPFCTVDCKIKKNSVNTGYSSQCSHIVIYRKEEWFKVFIHETIHNYGLDFSPIDTNCYDVLLNYFGIKKNLQLKLFEAYTESWARILNCLLLAFDEEQSNLDKFMTLAHRNIQIEQLFSFYQVCKILKYMDLSFGSMTTYEEETAVISYYFIGSILLSDYQNYIKWCHENNARNSLLQFDKNGPNKKELFCDYIIEKCKADSAFLEGIKQFKDIFEDGINFNDPLQITMKKTLLCRACEM